MRTQSLGQVPSLTSLYGKALGRTARAAAPGFLARTPDVTQVPAVRYTAEAAVDADHLAEYQHLLGEPGTDLLPAGYVHVLGFPLAMALMVREDFPLPVLGMVHVANRIEQIHPLTSADTLRIQAWAEGLSAHRSGTQVDLVVEVAGQEGPDPAWRGTSTYLAKGTTLPGLALAEPAEADQPAEAADLPRETARWNLPADTGRRYAAVSGDRNPIHMSALSAKPFGFRRAIAHGMYTAARALAAIGQARGPAFIWEVDFAKPVLLPSTVSFGQHRTQAGTHRYTGWQSGTDRVHFTGSVRPTP